MNLRIRHEHHEKPNKTMVSIVVLFSHFDNKRNKNVESPRTQTEKNSSHQRENN